MCYLGRFQIFFSRNCLIWKNDLATYEKNVFFLLKFASQNIDVYRWRKVFFMLAQAGHAHALQPHSVHARACIPMLRTPRPCTSMSWSSVYLCRHTKFYLWINNSMPKLIFLFDYQRWSRGTGKSGKMSSGLPTHLYCIAGCQCFLNWLFIDIYHSQFFGKK